MADKGENLFDECAARCANLQRSATLLPEGTVKYTHLLAKKFAEDANGNNQNWCWWQSKNFNGTSDNIRHFKTQKQSASGDLQKRCS